MNRYKYFKLMVGAFILPLNIQAGDKDPDQYTSILKPILKGASSVPINESGETPKKNRRLAFSMKPSIKIWMEQSTAKEIEKRDKEIQTLSHKIETLTLQNAFLRSQKEKLKTQNIPPSEAMQLLQAENQSLKGQIQQFCDQITLLQGSNEALGGKVNFLEQENISLKQKSNDNETLKSQVTELQLALHAANETIKLHGRSLDLALRRLSLEKDRAMFALEQKIHTLETQLKSFEFTDFGTE